MSTMKSAMHLNNKPLCRILSALAAFSVFMTSLPVYALDYVNATPVSGGITGSTVGNTTTINQTGQAGIINWTTFDMTSSEVANFHQPNASAVTLNRITADMNGTQIAGQINANGGVWVVDPNGVFIQQGASVNVGGAFVAAAMSVSDADFLAGRMKFSDADGVGIVANQGSINAGTVAALLGGAVINDGSIQASKAILSAGSSIVLDDNVGGGMITLSMDEEPSLDGVGADAIERSSTGMIDNTGDISALSITVSGGDIHLANGDGHGYTSGNITVRSSGTITFGNFDVVAGGGEPGDLTATAADAIIQDAGTALTVAGATTLDVGTAITLGNSGNDFNGVTADAGTTLTLGDKDDITLTRVGTWNGSIAVTAAGKITATHVRANGGGSDVTLHTTVGGIDSIYVLSEDAISLDADTGDVNVYEAIANNNVDITADAGSITEYFPGGDSDTDITGAAVTLTAGGQIGGTGELDIEVASTSLDLSSTAPGGNIYVTSTGAGGVALTSADTVNGSITVAANGGISVGTVSAQGDLTLTANGTITDITGAAIAVTGHGSLRGSAITLGDQPTDLFNAGSLTFNSAGAVSISEDSGTLLTGVSTANSLTLASAGTLSNDGTLSLTVAGNASLSGTSINLGNQAGDLFNAGSLTFQSTAGAVSISEDSDTLLKNTSTTTAGDLTLTSAGALANDVSSNLGVDGNASLRGTSIALNNQGSFGAVYLGSLTFNSAGNVQIKEDDSTLLSGTSTAGSLTLASAQTVTDSAGASVAVTGNATLSGTLIALDNPGNDFNAVTATAGTSVTLADKNGITLGTVNALNDLTVNAGGAVTFAGVATVGGNLTADANATGGTGGTITDSGAGKLLITGTTTLDAGDQAIALDNAGNDFNGVTATAGTTLTLADTDDITLAYIQNYNGPITVTAGGGINAYELISGTAVSLDANAGDVKAWSIAALGNVSITAHNGSITEYFAVGDATADIVGAAVTLTASGSIGGVGELDLEVNATSLDLSSTAAGGNIFVTSRSGGAVALTSADTVGGSITLAAENGGSMTVGTMAAGASGAVTLTAAGSILDDGNDLTCISGSALTLTAGTALGASGANGQLDTSVASVNATANNGGIWIGNTSAGAVTINSLSAHGGDISFIQTGAGSLTLPVAGTVRSGNPPGTDGGNVTLRSAGGLTIDGLIDTQAGTGGGLTIGGGVTLNHSPNLGHGSIVLDGGGLDITITAPLTVPGSLTLTAPRDIDIQAVVTTTGLTSDMTLTADNNNDGVGGVRVGQPGQLVSSRNVLIEGSDLFLTAAPESDSVLIVADGANQQIDATGNITLRNQGNAPATADMLIRGLVRSSGGYISVTAKDAIELAASVTAFNDIDLTATGGSITQTAGTMLTGDRLTLVAGAGIGTAANRLQTTVADIVFTAGGNVFVTEANALNVSGSTTANNGSVSVLTTDGSLTVNGAVSANGSGNVLLQAQTTGANDKDVALNAAVSSGSGNITVLANRHVTQAAAGDITVAGGAGSIDVEALGGSITMADGAVSQTAGGNIRYAAQNGDVTLGVLDARTVADRGGTTADQAHWGDVSVVARGSILDAQVDTVTVGADGFAVQAGGARTVNVYADGAMFVTSLGSIGSGLPGVSNPLDTEVATLAALAGPGGGANLSIYLLESTDVKVDDVDFAGVNRVGSDANVSANTGMTLLSDIITWGLNVKLETVNGSITVNDGSGVYVYPGIGFVANFGDSLLAANGAGSDVTLNALDYAGRNATVLARGSVVQNADINVSGGMVDVQAYDGSITMADGAVSQTMTSGNIRYAAGQDVTLGLLDAGAGSVGVVAGRDIKDNTAAEGVGNENITAASARLVAGNGVGNGTAAGDIDTVVGTVAAAAGAGGIYLVDSDAVTVGTVADVQVQRVGLDSSTTLVPAVAGASLVGETTTANGSIVQQTVNGTLTVNGAVSANGSGNVLLQAQTTGANDKDVIVNAAVSSGSGNITVLANRHVTQAAAGDITVAGGAGIIDVQALHGSITMADGAVSQTAGGNIRYTAAQDVTLGVLNAGAGDVSVQAGGNINDADLDQITVSGTGFASSAGNDVNIIANNLTLTAGGNIGATTADGAAAFDALDVQVNRVTATGANVAIYDKGDLAVNEVTATGVANLMADGSMIDGNGAAVNITCGSLITSAGQIIGANGAGGVDALEITIAGGGASDIWVNNVNGTDADGRVIAYFDTVGGKPSLTASKQSGSGAIIIINGQYMYDNPKYAQIVAAAEAFTEETPELTSRQGVFGSPFFLHGQMDFNEPVALGLIDFILARKGIVVGDPEMSGDVTGDWEAAGLSPATSHWFKTPAPDPKPVSQNGSPEKSGQVKVTAPTLGQVVAL